MKDHDALPPAIEDAIKERLGDRIEDYAIPPPVFCTMRGEFLVFDAEAGVLEEYLNPYGAMQGGMVAAAVDNTLGPLSMLVAPPNMTRRLQIKYSRQVTPELGYITVKGRLLERKGRWLSFSAEVRDPEGALLARAQARHWIVDLPAGRPAPG